MYVKQLRVQKRFLKTLSYSEFNKKKKYPDNALRELIHNFDVGLKNTIEWYLSNPQWWKDLSENIFEHTPWKK